VDRELRQWRILIVEEPQPLNPSPDPPVPTLLPPRVEIGVNVVRN